jgi:hypothetical protein
MRPSQAVLVDSSICGVDHFQLPLSCPETTQNRAHWVDGTVICSNDITAIVVERFVTMTRAQLVA